MTFCVFLFLSCLAAFGGLVLVYVVARLITKAVLDCRDSYVRGKEKKYEEEK